ncbi:unnamed protein product [Brachionus calyciflorus]|uniref:Nucleoporin NUP35 n=1 Tax=Brachionus calyciflorus TaxID=104777 RepID=A0A813ME25_9BILA|nr:unnamed protein product [Brachionus calyciflorus]
MMMSSPEPMSLGSPTQSPTSNQNTTSNVNQYLPQFLIGDHHHHSSRNNLTQSNNSKYWQSSNNPTNSPPRSQFGSHLFQNQSSSLSRSYSLNAYDVKPHYERPESIYGSHQQQQQQQQQHHHHHQQNPITPLHDRTLGSTSILNQSNLNQSQNIPGAPPVNRLADMMSKPTTFHTKTKPDLPFTPNSHLTTHHRLSPPSPTQVDPFYTYGEQIKPDDKLDDTWITVFGFPQSATSYVLQEFSNYGQILRHTSTQGNWLHIQFQTKLQAQKALSKNGKVLANNIMVGVMKCIDKSVMNGQQQANNNTENKTETNTDSLASLPKLNRPGATVKLDRSQSLRTGIRPLGQFNRNQDVDSSVNNKMPKKNTNVLSKAMEYMFGW